MKPRFYNYPVTSTAIRDFASWLASEYDELQREHFVEVGEEYLRQSIDGVTCEFCGHSEESHDDTTLSCNAEGCEACKAGPVTPEGSSGEPRGGTVIKKVLCPVCNGSGYDADFEHQRNVNYIDTCCRRCWGIGRIKTPRAGSPTEGER